MLSVRQSAGVPDLAAGCAAPVGGSVYLFAGGLDIDRVAEGAGFGRDACARGFGVHAGRLSALWIVSLAHPLFGYPVIADAPEANVLIAPKP